jgi:hypothetical protein
MTLSYSSEQFFQLIRKIASICENRGEMKKLLQLYVGRIVRLSNHLFQRIRARAIRQGITVENLFLVVGVDEKMRKLTCYGANFRLVVNVSDVILV